MSDHVCWMLELGIQNGRARDRRVLMTEMVSATRADEPGTLNYEWSITPDGTRRHLGFRR